MAPVKIDYSCYTLHGSTERHGALLRFTWKEGVGYGDLHLWPELGDAPLETHLQLGLSSPLIQRAATRAKPPRQFEGLKIPPSHHLVTHLETPPPNATHIKVKIGRYPNEIERLYKLATACPNAKLRLDANERFSREEFYTFLNQLQDLFYRIDFIEDPYPYNPITWAEDQVKLDLSFACDRQVLQAMGHPESAQVIVIKPALHPIIKPENQRLVITSNLSHPLELYQTAHDAATAGITEVCGLLSYTAYEPDPYSQRFSCNTNRLIPPPTLDDLLEKEAWTSL